MKIYRGYSDFKAKTPVVTIGMFDGVHLGHLSLISRVNKTAMELNGESVAITFEPHPRILLSGGDSSLRFLTSLDEKISLLEDAGLDHLIILPFTLEFSRISACEFVKQILVEGIGISHLVIGYDHHFGHKGKGSGETIADCAIKYGFSIERVEALTDNNISISSTTIRDFINTGKLSEANKLLGYDYFLKGSVVEGMRIGREFGYPTANLKPDYDFKLIPNNGVYAVEVYFEDTLYKSMLYIGTRPTLKESTGKRSIEANLFDYDGDMYNRSITIYFRHRLRDDIKFPDTSLLKRQIEKDKEDTLRILG